MTFDEAYKRLEEISRLMDDKNIAMEKSIELYSEATNLIAQCRKDIENAKLEIEKIENLTDKKG